MLIIAWNILPIFGAKISNESKSNVESKLTFLDKIYILARNFFKNILVPKIQICIKVKFVRIFGPKLVFWVECKEYIFFNVLPYKDQKSFRDRVVWDLKEPKFGLLLTNMSIITFLLLWKTEIEKSFPILMIVYPKRRRAE